MNKITINKTGTISLKDTIKNNSDIADTENLSLQLSINPNTTIIIVDDLTSFDELSGNKSITHTIEFIINENSDFSYKTKIIPSFDNALPEQNDDASSIKKNLTFKI